MKQKTKSKPQSNGGKKPCKPLSRTKAGTSAKPKSTGKSRGTLRGSSTSLKRGKAVIQWGVRYADGTYITFQSKEKISPWHSRLVKLEIKEVE